VAGGLVASLFTFALLPGSVRDEIDVELLTNDLSAGRERFLTNVFEDDDFSVPGDLHFVEVAGFDPSGWNEYEIQWLPSRVRWLLNGVLVREENDTLPDAPSTVRLNFWAPSATFPDAYDAKLQPASSVKANQTFHYEIDFVEVERLTPVPSLSKHGLLGLALLLLVAGTAQRRSRRRTIRRTETCVAASAERMKHRAFLCPGELLNTLGHEHGAGERVVAAR
jgi:hypothetical protein